MWRLWHFRPRPLWQPWKWSGGYYAWRLETYTGIPAHEVTWRTFVAFFCRPQQRRSGATASRDAPHIHCHAMLPIVAVMR